MANTAKPGCVYLKLNAGEQYTLNGIPEVGTFTFSRSSPVCPHPIPAEFVRALGLHTERVPQYGAEGETRESVARFLVSPRPFPAPEAKKVEAPADNSDLFAHSPDVDLDAAEAENAGDNSDLGTSTPPTSDTPAQPTASAVPATPEERGRPPRARRPNDPA